MNNSSKRIKYAYGLILTLGVGLLGVTLINKKTRPWALKALSFGLVVFKNRFFSDPSFSFAKVVADSFSVQGTKGGRSDRKRVFKRKSLSIRPALIM